ncbi:MAG: GNAT family N-acetyltransferase [Actinomycetota bacterium]|nr:GNAT family N-acetyltransferase [Actinomycetota bacterium]
MELIDTNAENISEYAICTYKNPRLEGYQRKMAWLKERYPEGLRFRIMHDRDNGTVGTIEYIPGDETWRAVEAAGYMVVHCLFIIPKEYKGKGHGSMMLEECMKDAGEEGMYGVAAVTRKGTWMAGKELFCKSGFEVVDKAPPDFELVVRKFKQKSPSPSFTDDWEKRLERYGSGLTILRSDQCPAVAKPLKEIILAARDDYGMEPRVIEVTDAGESRQAPSAYGAVFSLVYDGRLLVDHAISVTRFRNLMNKALGTT